MNGDKSMLVKHIKIYKYNFFVTFKCAETIGLGIPYQYVFQHIKFVYRGVQIINRID